MTLPTTTPRLGAFIFCALALAACVSTPLATRVQTAKSSLLGMTKQDVRMCAGFPQRHHEEAGMTTWGYETRSQAGGVNLSAPLWIANTNLSITGGGNCQAQFQFEDGRLTRLAYSGDNDGPQGRETLCAPIVEGCLIYLEENGRSEAPRPRP